jgi:hypothetical protein
VNEELTTKGYHFTKNKTKQKSSYERKHFGLLDDLITVVSLAETITSHFPAQKREIRNTRLSAHLAHPPSWAKFLGRDYLTLGLFHFPLLKFCSLVLTLSH